MSSSVVGVGHDVLEWADVSTEEGLTENEAERRRERFGPNELREAEQRHWTEVLTEQFESFIILLLAAAGIAAFVLGDVIEGSRSSSSPRHQRCHRLRHRDACDQFDGESSGDHGDRSTGPASR